MRRFYESALWITQSFFSRNPDFHHGLLAVWSYPEAYPEVGRISNFLSFEPDIISVHLDGKQLHLEPGQTVIPHGPDRELTVTEVLPRRKSA